MKLNLLEPNASYDLIHGVPKILEKDNDGSCLFRYNIVPEMKVPEDGKTKKAEQVGWLCREIRIWGQPTRSELSKSIIRSVVNEDEEMTLVNAYNKHVLGIKEDVSAVDNYKQYLQFTEDVDNMLASFQ